MKTRGIVFGLAAIAATAWSCQSTKPVIQPIQNCFGYDDWGYWIKEEPPSVHVCTDGEKPRILQFKGTDGMPVPGGGMIDAPGCLTVPFPPGGVSVDWLEAPRDGGDGGGGKSLVVPPHLPGSFTAAVQDFVPDDTQEYVFGCATLKGSLEEVARTYEIAVMATSLAEAQSIVVPIAYYPTGSPLPPGVSVHYHIEAQLQDGALVIRSSLWDKFDEFRVDINGQPVADVGTGQNVEVTHPGSRWTTIVATLPLSLLSESMLVELHQQGHTDPNELWRVLSF